MVTLNSLASLAKAVNVRIPSQKKNKVVKCSKCGNVLRKISNTNAMVCDAIILEEKTDPKTGKQVDVFGPCGNFVI